MYGGGPIIVRDGLDIYGRDLSKDLNQRSHHRSKDRSPIIPNIGFGPAK